jgi:hypothetical protein
LILPHAEKKSRRPQLDPVTYDDLPEDERRELEEKMDELKRRSTKPDEPKDKIPF